MFAVDTGRDNDDAIIGWLLEEDNPSVRFFCLTQLLALDSEDPLVVEAKQAIMRRGAVPALLAGQDHGGFWGDPDRLYTAKYQGTAWRVLLLAELGADGTDAAVRAACEFILAASQEPGEGGFSMHRSGRSGGGRPAGVIPCLTGNMVWSLARLGYGEDPRVRHGVDWIVRYQRFDDGVAEPPSGAFYDRYEICFGRHTCHMGAVKALKALCAVPAHRRTAGETATVQAAVEYLLAHRIHRRSHDLTKVAKPGWLRLSFPLMYQTDVLEILLLLTELGIVDERMQDAVRAVDGKRGPDGRWRQEGAIEPDRFPIAFEAKGAPSKWVTLRAMLALKRWQALGGG